MLGRSMAGDHYLKDELYELVRTDRTVFDFLQSGSLDGLWYWDLENLEVEWISPEFWRILGYDPAEKPHLASEWHKVLAPEGRESALERLRRYAEDPNHRYDEIVRYLHADGSAVWLRCRGLVIRDAEGTPTRMLGVHNDVTALQNARVDAERLRTEVEAHQVHESERRSALERLNRDLKRSNTELSTFAFTASHDLKEPLRSVTAYAEILQERIGAELDPKSQQQLARILEGGRRMERLIEDLLELAQAGAAEFLVSNVDLNTCVAAVLENLQAMIERTGATVRVEPLPVVRGDSRQLVRVFQNLLVNSMKYVGGRPAEVTVSAGEDGVVTVSDNGIGFAPEQAEKLFVAFERLHSQSDYPGTGIGLASVKRIIERHGGSVWAEGRPGEGATFYISLPETSSSAGEATSSRVRFAGIEK